MWKEKNEYVVQLVGKEGENDVVSSPHGSLIRIERRRKICRATSCKKMVLEYEQIGDGGEGGEVFRTEKGKNMVDEK
jgi:GTPase involved in cell partitioning and DNA repair